MIIKSIKTSLSISLFIGISMGCETAVTTKSADNPGYSAEVEARIDRVINNLQVGTEFDNVYESKSLTSQMEKYHTPGVSIAVINEGTVEWARGFGKRDVESGAPVDIHTLFEAGSVSKPIFAMAVMKLKEKGVLDLDEDVNEYLRSWKVPKNGDWQPKISLRQLLSHTAGLTVHGFPGYLKSEPIPTVPQILNGEPPANTGPVKVNILPGTTLRYSGGGTTVAQLAVMDHLDQSFPAIIQKELFAPLELQYSTYQQPLPDSLESIASTAYPYKGKPINGRFHTYPEMAAAGLWSNPSELANLLIEVQKALKGESSLFQKETIEEMLTPQKVAQQVGIGFFLDHQGDSARFGHGGWDEGFVTQVTAFQTQGKGAVIMVNSNEGNSLLREIMRAIAIEYNWPGYMPAATEYVPVDINEIQGFKGIYASTKGSKFEIDLANDALTLQYDNQDPIPLLRTDEGAYTHDQFNFNLTFAEGVLHFNQRGRTVKYMKE